MEEQRCRADVIHFLFTFLRFRFHHILCVPLPLVREISDNFCLDESISLFRGFHSTYITYSNRRILFDLFSGGPDRVPIASLHGYFCHSDVDNAMTLPDFHAYRIELPIYLFNRKLVLQNEPYK